MLVVRHTLLSNWIAEKFFVCHLEKCKGACCVEGESGAPLELEELPILKSIQKQIAPYLTETARDVLTLTGPYVEIGHGDYATPTIGGRECVYSFYDQQGHLKCAIEKAYREKKISFPKPISCHLYPIRIKKCSEQELVNYETWNICQSACQLGEELQIPLYQFLKEPLIRRYGEEWYQELLIAVEEYQQAKKAQKNADEKKESL